MVVLPLPGVLSWDPPKSEDEILRWCIVALRTQEVLPRLLVIPERHFVRACPPSVS